MTTSHYLPYPLTQGYIHNWLVAGPHAQAIEIFETFTGPDFKQQISEHYYQAETGLKSVPVDQAKFTVDGVELQWKHFRCADDHFVNVTDFYHTPHYLRTWAYAEVDAPYAQDITLVLTTNAPADVWLNGEHIHRQAHIEHQIPKSVIFSASLNQGPNQILVRFEAIGVRECPYLMALKLQDFVATTIKKQRDAVQSVRLPTANAAIERYQALESFFQSAYFDRDTFVHDNDVTIRWPKGQGQKQSYTIRLQKPPRRIYAETSPNPKAQDERKFGRAFEFPEGLYEAFIIPPPEEYYQHNLRVEVHLPLRLVRKAYTTAPQGTLSNRAAEALKDAAERNVNIFSEIAKMAIGWWENVNIDVIMQTIADINQRQDCSDFYLTGLLGMHLRYQDDENYPTELKEAVEACALNFRYWLDEPGQDAMCFWSENHQILFHACEIMAGQLLPEQSFSNNNQTGQWHQKHGEEMALAWLRKRAKTGFAEWDSNCYFEHDVLALIHILDHAETETVWQLAAVVLDKILVTMALNSYQGVFGSTHGRTYSRFIKGSHLEPTSGLMRLMFGVGTWNDHILGTVSMACSQNYELPIIIAKIATDIPEEMWSQECHKGEFDPAVDLKSGAWEINKVTYKTPDYMLASAQDYQPGQPGYQQHIWQATLGPEAVVFVTHPPCLSEDGSHRPNAWQGNVILPRVAQWQDVLIAVHNLPADDWLGFTHAYFPYYAFDEHDIRKGWAFGRKGDGYIALRANQDLKLSANGLNAYRELRAYGEETIWICQMGRKAVDGEFKDFCQKVLKETESEFNGLNVRYKSLRGQALAFGWTGPFTIDGEEQALTSDKHYNGPNCVAEWDTGFMAVGHNEDVLRLDFNV